MAEQASNKPVLESLDGVVIKVERGNEPLIEKEWLLSKVNLVSRQKSNIEGWNDSFHWEFLIIDERARNRKVWSNSSLYVTQGTRTYNWIISILNLTEIPVGGDIKMTDLIGKYCYIMMVPSTSAKNKGKGKQVVGEIKACTEKVDELNKDVEEIKEATTKKETKAASKKAEEPEDSTDEIDIEDINLDDI